MWLSATHAAQIEALEEPQPAPTDQPDMQPIAKPMNVEQRLDLARYLTVLRSYKPRTRKSRRTKSDRRRRIVAKLIRRAA